MKSIIELINWRAKLKNIDDLDSIGTDFVIIDNISANPQYDFPFKLDVTISILCITGSISGKINLKPFTSVSPCYTIVLPDQILEHGYVSDDFTGLVILISKGFSNSLNLQERLQVMLSIQNNPSVSLSIEELNSMIAFYRIMQRAVRQKDNPYRTEVVQCLIKAFFYSTQFHKLPTEVKKTKNETLIENFLVLAQTHYKQQRSVEFYADKLCLTPKYLSKVIKHSTGQSASEWIDSFVLLEAKALLKSTNQSIQQISDELHFPSQSFFGKYFKRLSGMSPKEYKNNQ